MSVDTLPKLLKHKAEQIGSGTAMREKHLGVWREFTWHDYYESVRDFGLGLISLGLEPEDVVALIGDNKPPLFWAVLGIQSIHGIPAPLTVDANPSEINHLMTRTECKFVVAHDQEQVDKILQIADGLPFLQKVIYWDAKGLSQYESPLLISFDEIMGFGRQLHKAQPDLFDNNIQCGTEGDIIAYTFTSGTSGEPKVVVLTHKALIGVARAWAGIDRWRDGDDVASYLPLAWIGALILDLASPLISGVVLNFVESPETLQDDLRDIAPAHLFYGPRNWEGIVRMVQMKINDADRFNRFLFRAFLPVGYKMVDIYLDGNKPDAFWKTLNYLGYWAVFRELRDKLGLGKIKHAYCAGSGVSPDIFKFFCGIGINLKQAYGLAEGGIACTNPDGQVKPDTCGIALAGNEIRLAKDGEVLVRSPNMFSEYLGDPSGTAERLKDGWCYTGDCGSFDADGHLIIIDRMDALRRLGTGHRFSPQFCETRLRFNPYIRDAIVIGREDNDYVCGLVNIDFDSVGKWAEARHIPYTTFADLSQKTEVIELIRTAIREINRKLPEAVWIRRFVNLHKEFDPDEAELTRTRKLRRTFLEDYYGDLVTAIYHGLAEFQVEAKVTYRDGRQATAQLTIKLNSAE